MDKIGGKGEEEGDHKEDVVLIFAKFVEVGERVVHEQIGDGDLRVEDDGEGGGFDVGRESRDKAGGHGSAEVDEDREDNQSEETKNGFEHMTSWGINLSDLIVASIWVVV